MVHSPDPLKRLDAALSTGRRLLRLRGAVRGAARGAWVGAVAAVLSGLLRQLGLLDDLPAVLLAVGLLLASIGLGTVIGALWRTLEDRETALLLDRALDTEELLVTATWLRSTPPSPRRNAVLDELAAAHIPPLSRALPVRTPRHSRWLALPLLAALLALVLPAWRPAMALRAAQSEVPLVQEGSRLADRVAEAEAHEGIELPEGIETEIAKLAHEMQGEQLTPEEALQRLAEMQEQLDAFEKTMAEQKDVLNDLEKAASALEKNPATKDLADALSDLDMGGASDAAKELADKLGMQGAAERKQAADAMEKAGKQLAQSADPSMKEAGEALEQAAKAARGESGQQGEGQQGEGQQGEGQQGEGQQGEGQQGQQQGAGGQGLSPKEAQELADALEKARAAGEQLQKDKEALERSQELNGALEGSRQRLGGEPSVEDGEGQGEGAGEQGQGNQQGDGEGQGGEGQGDGGEGQGEGMGQAGNGVGGGHTWEDQGEFTDAAESGDGGRQDASRTDGQVINDFERLYKSVRDEDAEHLLTSVEGQLDTTGQIDELPIRLTTSDERAEAATVQLPAAYREAAAEAVTSEQVPPGYREAVKQYFDEMEQK